MGARDLNIKVIFQDEAGETWSGTLTWNVKILEDWFKAPATEFAYARHSISILHHQDVCLPDTGMQWHSSSPELWPLRILVSCETSGGTPPAATRHLVALQLDLFSSCHILAPFSTGVRIKTDISFLLQSPPSPDHNSDCVTHTCISTTILCVPWGKYLQSSFCVWFYFLLLFFHLGVPGFSHPFTIADAWELFDY